MFDIPEFPNYIKKLKIAGRGPEIIILFDSHPPPPRETFFAQSGPSYTLKTFQNKPNLSIVYFFAQVVQVTPLDRKLWEL